MLLTLLKLVLTPILALFISVGYYHYTEVYTVPPEIPCFTLNLGSITKTTAVLWLKTCKEGNEIDQTVELSSSNGTIQLGRADKTFGSDNDEELIGTVEFKELIPDETYKARFKNTTVSFRTFPEITRKDEELVLTFGSCSSVTVNPPWNDISSGFDAIAGINPRLAFFLGDNVYTDISERFKWHRIPFEASYKRLLTQKAVQRVFQQVPTYFQFDDHEIENDVFGMEHGMMDEALGVYRKYLGNRNPGRPANASRMYYSYDYGDMVSFFVSDSRLHADPDAKTMFGNEQRNALFKWLARGKAKEFDFLVLASPLSFSADGHGDLFEKDRETLLTEVAKLGLKNVIIISGDMHFGAAYEYGPGVYEFSASPFAAFPFWAEDEHRSGIGARSDYKRIFIHSAAYFFGKLTLRKKGSSKFELYKWPLLQPSTPAKVFDEFSFGG